MEEIKHFTVKELSKIVGIPQRRIQFYLLQNLITPDLEASSGRGVAHKFSFTNLVELFFIKELNEMGVTLSVIKKIFDVYFHEGEKVGSTSISVRRFLVMRAIDWIKDPEIRYNSYLLISQTESGIDIEHIPGEYGNGENLLEKLEQKKSVIVINLANIINHLQNITKE